MQEGVRQEYETVNGIHARIRPVVTKIFKHGKRRPFGGQYTAQTASKRFKAMPCFAAIRRPSKRPAKVCPLPTAARARPLRPVREAGEVRAVPGRAGGAPILQILRIGGGERSRPVQGSAHPAPAALQTIKYLRSGGAPVSNWDLMMPGMGLTSIGLAGVVISYAGIAHTFIDGMHALTGLTMFVGLIFLSAGILEGGVSTSNRAKATVLVVLAISLSFGAAALVYNTISTVPTFAAVMMILATPAIVIAYLATKMPQYLRPVGLIFALAAVAGVSSFVAFGMVGPDTYLIDEPEPVEEEAEDGPPAGAETARVSILAGSDQPDAPDYDPDELAVERGVFVVWTNDDAVAHTVTSQDDAGASFDSGLVAAGEEFSVDTSALEPGEYPYYCIVHPWMESALTVAEASGGEGGGISPDAEG